MNSIVDSRKKRIYERYIKRFLDVLFAVLILLLFWWIYLIVAITVRIKLGRPVLFSQQRPGMIDSSNGKERIFNLYKFRTMSDEKDEFGELLPDECRLGKFGKALRASSLDELPEIINILKGEMSFVGPRPQLVRDMVFMSDEERVRHTARPGLTGLAQIKGRNAISWAEKFRWDSQYISKLSFILDVKIVALTLIQVFSSLVCRNRTRETELTADYGVWLLKNGKVSSDYYEAKIREAKIILTEGNK